MTSCNLEKWRKLLREIEVTLEINDEPLHLNEEQLLDFESQAGVMLPSGYKEFCQIFGRGGFCDDLVQWSIDCPDLKDIEGHLISSADIIAAQKSSLSQCKNRDLVEVQRLLDSAYLFGMGPSIILIFDLRTYSELDESYDIYAIDDDGRFYKVGRDFFEFIRDFCMGTKAEEEFLELLMGMLAEFEEGGKYGRKTFVQFSYEPSSSA